MDHLETPQLHLPLLVSAVLTSSAWDLTNFITCDLADFLTSLAFPPKQGKEIRRFLYKNAKGINNNL